MPVPKAKTAYEDLTERQAEVLALAGRGLTIAEIADALNINGGACHNHVRLALGVLVRWGIDPVATWETHVRAQYDRQVAAVLRVRESPLSPALAAANGVVGADVPLRLDDLEAAKRRLLSLDGIAPDLGTSWTTDKEGPMALDVEKLEGDRNTHADAMAAVIGCVLNLPDGEELVDFDFGKLTEGGYWWQVSSSRTYGNTNAAARGSLPVDLARVVKILMERSDQLQKELKAPAA